MRARHNEWQSILQDLDKLHPDTDLLACNLASFAQCHEWYWWWNGLDLHQYTKKADKLGLPMSKNTYSRDVLGHRSFAGIYRMSARFVNKLDSNLGEVTAYGELYLPTLCAILKRRDASLADADLTGMRKGKPQKPWYFHNITFLLFAPCSILNFFACHFSIRTMECIKPPFVSSDPMYVERKIGLDQVVREANPFPVNKGRLVVVTLAKEWSDLQREQLEAYLNDTLKIKEESKYNDVKGFTAKAAAAVVSKPAIALEEPLVPPTEF